jgi:hypothetical protein
MAQVEPSVAMLVPSQAIDTSNSNSNNQGNQKMRKSRRNKSKTTGENSANNLPAVDGTAPSSSATPSRQNKNRRRNKSKQSASGEKEGEEIQDQSSGKGNAPQQGRKKGNQTRPVKGDRNRFPWRRYLNNSYVDPITLEPLNTLPYPPFALCADAPYVPVAKWPVPEEKDAPKPNAETEIERQARVLQEQWGSVPIKIQQIESKDAEQPPPLNKRKLNLFDGRALAYYMVSQLQFIDPLNRRDLTRDELVNLDEYLKRAGFNDLNVTEAYDVKGISLSSAGATGSTGEGRALIRQQEAQRLAQSLLESVFAGASVASRPTGNSLQAQYEASQRQDQQRQRRNRSNNRREIPEERGIYGDEGAGLIVIDDDANPGLRGGGAPAGGNRLDAPAFTPGNLWLGSRYVSHTESVQASNFPALRPASAPPTSQAVTSQAAGPAQTKKPPSLSLARISNVVAKTSEKEIQKQREARELFIKRAAMSNQAFGVDSQAQSSLVMPPPPPPPVLSAGPTEGQLLRNQAFASALGVAPATVRQQSFNEGWARPTDSTPELDEFGNELIEAVYSDSLIIRARERMPFLLKLEKKWTTFLADDNAASLPLNKMDRPLRTFVHEYSDFWKLQTESFDPEPNRYIHCVKLRDTSAPRPLLSVAARKWRGPRPVVADFTDHTVQQTAGQTPREFPPPPAREPLQLKSRGTNSLPSGAAAPRVDTESEAQINSRSDELFTGRERPRLALAPRTLPVELPPMEKAYSLAEERERQKVMYEEKLRIERQEAERKRRILESVYASDDDEKSLKSHDSDEWDELETGEGYSGSDDDEII